MRFGAIGHLVAHARFQHEPAAILQLGVQFAFQAQKNMPLLAPVVGQVTGRIFDHANADVAEVPGPPIRDAGFALVFGALDIGPVDGFKRAVRYFHEIS